MYVQIDVGKEYEVQWGLGKDDAATADVLASGTEVEMKKKKTEQERQASAAETVSRKPTATAKRKTQAPAPAATSAEQERQTSAADTVPRKPTATAKRKTQASAPAATSPAKKARKTTVTTSKTKASKKVRSHFLLFNRVVGQIKNRCVYCFPIYKAKRKSLIGYHKYQVFSRNVTLHFVIL